MRRLICAFAVRKGADKTDFLVTWLNSNYIFSFIYERDLKSVQQSEEYILFGVLAVQKISFSEHIVVVQCSKPLRVPSHSAVNISWSLGIIDLFLIIWNIPCRRQLLLITTQ